MNKNEFFKRIEAFPKMNSADIFIADERITKAR